MLVLILNWSKYYFQNVHHWYFLYVEQRNVLLYSITTSQQDEQKLATLNNTAAFMILKLILNYPPKASYF